jgi:L-alanine-DL-glutamate epimerase-like enolase superfamily enzyme
VPGFADSFMINGETIRVLYDRTHHSNSDGKTTRDESTLLMVIDDQLVGWGEITIEKATR